MALTYEESILKLSAWEGAEIVEESTYFSIYTYRPQNPQGMELIEDFIQIINDITDYDYSAFAEANCEVLFYVEEEEIFGAIIHSEVAGVPSMTKVTHLYIVENCDYAHLIKWLLYHFLEKKYTSITEGTTYAELTVTIGEI